MSKEDINKSGFWFLMFLANSKESFDTYLFLARSYSMGTKIFAMLYDGVLIAEIIGRNGGDSSPGLTP